MFGIKWHLFLFINFVSLFSSVFCKIPRSVLCADRECSVPISEAQGTILYQPIEDHVLGFNKGTKMHIMSKTKEEDGYFIAKIKDRIGFVPPRLIKEIRVWNTLDMLKYEVPIVPGSFPFANDNVIKKNTAVNEDNTPENQNAGTSQATSQSPLRSIINGEVHKISNELIIDTQNQEMKNSGKEIPKPTVGPISNSPQEDGIIKIPTIVNAADINAQERFEAEKKTVEEEESIPTVTQINSSVKKVGSNSESLENNKNKSLLLSISDSQLDKSAGGEQINVDQKSSMEINILTNESSINENAYTKNQEGNLNQNSDNMSVVTKNEYQSVHSSNNLETSDSNSEVSGSGKVETKDVEKIQLSHETGVVNANEVPGAIDEPPVKDSDSSVTAKTDSSIRTEEKSSANDKHYGNSQQNILSNNGEGTNIKAQIKSDTGTAVNVNNENLLKLGMNADLNENLAHENTVNVSASVSSSSSYSSNSIVSNSLPSANNIHVKSMNDNLKQSGLPSPESQEVDNTDKSEGVNAPGAQFVHSSQQGIPQDGFHSTQKSHPSVSTSSTQISYNHMQHLENSNSQAVELYPTNVAEVRTTDVPPLEYINTNINEAASEQFDTPISTSLHLDYVKSTDSSQPSSEGPSSNSEEEKLGNTNFDITGAEPSLNRNPNDEIKEFQKEIVGTTQLGNVDELIRENFDNALPNDSSAEAGTLAADITENPPENSNFEFFTAVPPPAVATDSDHNAEEVQERDVTIGETLLRWIGLASKKESVEQEGNLFEETFLNKPSSSEFSTGENVIAPDETCKTLDGSTNCNEVSSDENNSIWSFWLDNKNMNPAPSYNTFIYLVVTAITVLLFTLGYYFIEKFRSDGPLIAKVNRLEQELLVSSKECLILKDELTNTKDKLNLFETSSNDKIITALQQELEEAKKTRNDLENNIEVLQQELDAATEAGLDLNKMLSEVLTQKGGSESLMESVEHLQAQLNNQQKIIDEMTSKLFTKTNENQELQDELTAANEKIENLEGEIENIRGNLNVHLKDNEDVIEDLKSRNHELELKMNEMNETKKKEIAKLKKNVAEFERKLKTTSDSLKIKEEECNNLKDSVKTIKVKDGKSIDSLFESSRIKAELGHAKSENASLRDCLKAEEGKFAKLENEVEKMSEEIQKLKKISSEAEKEKSEAQTRLEVLSNYFKEKETQLQKELGLREAMWLQKQGDDSTIYEKMKHLEEEINNYKSQNEALKKEVLDQERGLKAQIGTLEKKAHENWIAARQAERKLEETKQEAAQLRNKMTLMEKNISNDLESSQHHRVNDELNGGDALSPLIHDTSSPILFPLPLPLDPNNASLMPPGFIPPPMFMPPPPGGFMPHPPPFLPGDHRPPPLGRMSSPPLNNRFSPLPPHPPDYTYDRMSTPPLSPSNRNYRSPNESDRERERFRHRTPTSPSFRSRNWEEGPSAGMAGFRPITSERDSRRDHKGGSNLSSGHSSDSLDKSSRHSSRV